MMMRNPYAQLTLPAMSPELRADLDTLMNDGKPRAGWSSPVIPCSFLFALANRHGDFRLYDTLQSALWDAGWVYEIEFDAWNGRKRQSA